MMAFGNIEGIAPEIEAALLAVQITSPEQLLQMGSSPAGRKELAARTGIDARQLTELLNGVDLARVKGISEVFSNERGLRRPTPAGGSATKFPSWRRSKPAWPRPRSCQRSSRISDPAEEASAWGSA